MDKTYLPLTPRLQELAEAALHEHRCLDDLANLQLHFGEHGDEYICVVCGAIVSMGGVVESLRERAVARDAADRLTPAKWSEEQLSKARQ